MGTWKNTCKPMAVSFQCMTKSSTIKKKKKGPGSSALWPRWVEWGWDGGGHGRETQEGGRICKLTSDSLHCTERTNKTLWNNYACLRAQLCLTFFDSMNCSSFFSGKKILGIQPTGFHLITGIQSRDQNCVSCIAGGFFAAKPLKEWFSNSGL